MPLHSRHQARSPLPGSISVDFEADADGRHDPASDADDRKQRDRTGDRDPEPGSRSRADVAVGSLGGPWYRTEAWLVVALASFVPVVTAVFVPQSLKVPMIGLGGVLLVAGLVMFPRRGR
jgi:hypothetical protein